ncbi:hypothetical protein [Paenibacillus lutimineralis]|uniref:Uncharacterized protein n=1 Tax=Paenibacillus lutimineralis TaxID=2707005 RepID=A0A3Q9I6K3_9BACL|nr:hypothetical protein [Paenibacillus lutimineralis]AZS13826.1 hypothetical protein EI981_04740 [Paenibacillus lutimineralis]
MDFWIQASRPKYTGLYDKEDQNLSNAIETIFPMMTEKALIFWKTIYIPLCYKYDISWMIDNILDIFEMLRSKPDGEISLKWASNTFSAVWNIRWMDEEVVIAPEWYSVLGHTEHLLNSKGAIMVPIRSFISEWKKILGVILVGLKESGYNEKDLCGMKRLISEYNAIESEGVLYV